MKVIKRKDVLRMRSKFRMLLLYSRLAFLKVVFHDLKSMICHLNEGLKTKEQEKHIKTNQRRKTYFAQYYGRYFIVGLTFDFRKRNTLRQE